MLVHADTKHDPSVIRSVHQQAGEFQDERQPYRCGDRLHAPRVLLPLHTIAERDIKALLHILPPLVLRRQRVLPMPGLGRRAQLQAHIQG